MSLKVDLMLPDERRVVTPIHPKTMLQILMGTLIVLVIFWGISVWNSYRLRIYEQQVARARWAKMEVRQKEAAQMSKNLMACREIHGELQGWHGTRLPLAEWMERLAELCPPAVQLTTLRMTATAGLFGPKNATGRRFELRLTGRTGGPQADRNVRILQDLFTQHAPFSNVVESVLIPPGAFRQDPAPGAAKSDRVFELAINCSHRVFP